MCLTPFTIKDQVIPPKSTPDATTTTDTNDALIASTEATISGLMILFNLALAHHTKDRASMKAYSIYQIAITLLSALPPPSDSQSLMLHIAILNNCGVWCFENNEFSFMAMCFEETLHVLDETYSADNDITLTFCVGVKRGIFHNLRAVLNDQYIRRM